MIDQKTIEEVKKRLVKVYDPIKIYLFGSYAWGNPTEDSDLDLLVVVESSDDPWYKRSRQASDALWDLIIPKDLVVYTKDEFENRSGDVTSFCSQIKAEGKILYVKPV